MAVLGSAPVVLKIVGPTADYLGGGLKNLVELQVKNVEAIFSNAATKLGEDGLDQPGSVPPKVLKEILEQGAFCDETLGTEYFGGILASSKSGVKRDDRGATLASLVGRLSTYQLRCHYLMYAHAQRRLAGSELPLGIGNERKEHAQFFMPYETWIRGMDFSDDESPRFREIAVHCGLGLVRENLIEESFASAEVPENLEASFGRDFGDRKGIVFELSVLGIELFMAAHGMHQDSLPNFVSTDGSCEVAAPIDLSGEIVALNDLPASTG